jgi:DnaJ-class molecular chaperone
MSSIKKECPRCKGERGFWINKTWHGCITCKTHGAIRVASMAEFRRIEAGIEKPEKVQTKQREKERG